MTTISQFHIYLILILNRYYWYTIYFFIYIYLKQIEIISNLYNIEKNEYNIIVVIN